GYDVLVAEGGDLAIRLLTAAESPRIDAVVLDLVMPDLDGHGVLARLRDAASAVPIIVQTAHGGIDNAVSAMRAGATDFVVKPVVAVTCGASPGSLVESGRFGRERGAVTGATDRHTGKFVEASGGSLFLDEVGELPLAAQVKLLRAIQEGEVEPVGARKPVKV